MSRVTRHTSHVTLHAPALNKMEWPVLAGTVRCRRRAIDTCPDAQQWQRNTAMMVHDVTKTLIQETSLCISIAS